MDFRHNIFKLWIAKLFQCTTLEKLKNVNIDQGIHKGKMKVALNEKQTKLHGFSFSINIANFEAFL